MCFGWRCIFTDFTVRSAEDSLLFAPYLPTLDEHSTKGWMDIVCIVCLVVLSVSFDRRGYLDSIPQDEILQQEHVISMYQRWWHWFTVKYVGRNGDAVVEWEADVFTVSLYMSLGFRLTVTFGPRFCISSELCYVIMRKNGMILRIRSPTAWLYFLARS
jgi:hypothetical protein